MAKNSIEETLARHKREKERLLQRQQEMSKTTGSHQPEMGGDIVGLGTFIKGDIIPPDLGFHVKGGWVSFNDKVLDRHMFVLGTTGAGKTVSLIRIIEQVLKNTDRRIYFVDGKGEMDLAHEVATLAYQYRGEKVPVFKLGHEEKGAVYHGFVGSKEDIFNRLGVMAGINEMTGNATFYADINASLLQLICGVGYDDLPIEPPRSFTEVLERLSYEWLLNTYADVPLEKRMVEEFTKQGHIGNLFARMARFGRSFRSTVDPSGFTLEGVKAAIFSLRTASAGVDSKALLEFLVEDIKDWMGKRQQTGVKGLLVIDEFGTFSNENITDVLALARSAGLGVILATQDTSTLGDEQQAQRILSNCNTYIVMKTNFPEQMVELAGTVYRLEFTYQVSEGDGTGLGSGRFQHQFKVTPNEVAKLRPGEGFIINSRDTSKVQVSKVPDFPINPDAIAPIVTVKRASKEKGAESAGGQGVDIPMGDEKK